MSQLLQQAISALNLQPGQTFRTQVNGHEVEVRVLEEAKQEPAEEPSQFEDMVMLEPWFTMPDTPAIVFSRSKLVPLPLPDPPQIPDVDEEME